MSIRIGAPLAEDIQTVSRKFQTMDEQARAEFISTLPLSKEEKNAKREKEALEILAFLVNQPDFHAKPVTPSMVVNSTGRAKGFSDILLDIDKLPHGRMGAPGNTEFTSGELMITPASGRADAQLKAAVWIFDSFKTEVDNSRSMDKSDFITTFTNHEGKHFAVNSGRQAGKGTANAKKPTFQMTCLRPERMSYEEAIVKYSDVFEIDKTLSLYIKFD